MRSVMEGQISPPEGSQTELLDLPNELLELIFRQLPSTSEIASFRLVSKRTSAVVEELIGVHARVDRGVTSRPQLQFYRRTGIRSALLIHSAKFDGKVMEFDRTIKRPNLLRAVTFEGKTSPQLPLDYLRGCHNLENFHLYGKITGLMTSPTPQPQFNLPRLQSMDLRMIYPEDGPSAAFISALNTFAILDAVDCPSLKTFCAEVWAVGPMAIGELHACLLEFLQKNGTRLEKMFICLRWRDGEAEWMTPSPQALDRLIDIRNRRYVSLKGCFLSKISLEKAMAALGLQIKLKSFLISINLPNDPWVTFLQGQKTLEKVGICDDLGLMGWTPLEISVKLNKASLRTVYIMSHFFLHDQFNFACFEGCQALEELLMINLNFDRDPAILALALGVGPNAANNPNFQHIANFDIAKYCPNLTFLATTNISFPRDKLNQLLELGNLQHLALLNAGEGHGVGVTFDLMKALLFKRSLEGLALDGIIASSTDQLQEINALISSLKDENDPEAWNDYVLNIRDFKDPTKRKWSRGEQGFVFDIDFYADN